MNDIEVPRGPSVRVLNAVGTAILGFTVVAILSGCPEKCDQVDAVRCVGTVAQMCDGSSWEEELDCAKTYPGASCVEITVMNEYTELLFGEDLCAYPEGVCTTMDQVCQGDVAAGCHIDELPRALEYCPNGCTVLTGGNAICEP